MKNDSMFNENEMVIPKSYTTAIKPVSLSDVMLNNSATELANSFMRSTRLSGIKGLDVKSLSKYLTKNKAGKLGGISTLFDPIGGRETYAAKPYGLANWLYGESQDLTGHEFDSFADDTKPDEHYQLPLMDGQMHITDTLAPAKKKRATVPGADSGLTSLFNLWR